MSRSRPTSLPGHRWRWLAWHRTTGEKHEQTFEPKDGVCFDELVIDNWFHLEQMSDRVWWLGLGRGGNLLHIRIEVPVKGQIQVGIEDEGEEGIVSYYVGADRSLGAKQP